MLCVLALAGLLHGCATTRDSGPVDPELLAAQAQQALDAGDVDAAASRLRDAAEAAALTGRTDLTRAYGESLSALLGTPPEWIEERSIAAEGLPETEDAFAALEFVDSMWSEVWMLADEGDVLAAIEVAEQAVAVAEDAFGPAHALVVQNTLDLANLYYAAQDDFGAETALLLALDKATEAYGAAHPRTLEVSSTLADLHESLGRGEDAARALDEALAAAEAEIGGVAPRLVDLRLSLARRLEGVGEYARAASLLEETCAYQEQQLGRWHAATADCLEQFGILLSRGGDLPGSREVFGDVLDIREGVLGDTDAATLATRLDLATLDRQDGRLEEALAALEALEASLIDSPEAAGALQVDVMETMARVYFDLGRAEEAALLAEGVLDARTAELGEAHPLALDALNLLGAVRLRQGELLAAEEAWRRVLAGYEELYGDANLATITAMANLGLVLETQGLYDEAEPLLRGAVDISGDMLGPGHPQTLTSMNNLALLHESQGQFDRAEPLYLLPIEILTSTLGAEHPRTISVTNNLAFLYMMEERYDEALALFEQVHAGFAGAVGERHQDTLKSLNNLGRVQRRLAQLDEAESTIARALELRREVLGPRHIDVQRSMRDLGVVWSDQGRLDEAEALLDETLDLNEQVLGAQHPYTFETLNSLADVLERQGRTQEAFDLRRTGFERRSEFLDRMLWVTSDNAREGYIRLHRPELDAYLTMLPEVGSVQGGRELLEVSLQRKGLLLKISSEIQQIASMELNPELASLTDQLTRAREELASLTLAGPEGADPDEHLQRMNDLEFRVDDLQAELGRASVRFRESVADLSAQDLVDNLPLNSALVDYMMFTDTEGHRRLMAGVLRIHDDGRPTMRLVVYDDLDEIEGIIQEYREIIQDEGVSDDDVMDVGNIAWELIWEPVLEDLPEDGPIYLVPDGVLNILPWDALVDADFEYLLHTTDLRILSSTRDLVPSEIAPAQGAVMVLAGPDYDTEDVAGEEVLAAVRGRRAAMRAAEAVADEVPSAQPAAVPNPPPGTRGSRAARFESMRGISVADLDSRSAVALASLRAASSGMRGLVFSPLPGAELEGNLIAEQVDEGGAPTILLTQGEAEEQILSEMTEPPRVLHIATHGFFLEPNEELRQRLAKTQRSADVHIPPPGDNPLLRAGLAFAGINSNAPFLGELDTRNDGVLTALEVLSLDLSGTQLAILSACETGLGEIHEGEGVYGLRRSFQEAGVQEIITSLWEVSDAGTQALMTEMYQRLLAGEPPREALRNAQRELANSPRWGYPFIWSAFMIVGK